jgi:hypothetical protein
MPGIRSFLGYTAAALTIAVAFLTPFLLIGLFSRGVARTGIRINDAYSGGEARAEIDRGAYRVVVNKPVLPTAPLQRLEPFVQVSWSPAAKLPETVAEVVDLDRDGKPDADIRFRVPRDPAQPLEAEVTALSPATASVRLGRGSFSSMICRAGDRIVVRLPWTGK